MSRLLLAAVLLFLLGGCNPQEWEKGLVPQEQAKLGREYVEDIRTGKFEPIEAKFDVVFQTALPLGAMIFWMRRPRWLEDAAARR